MTRIIFIFLIALILNFSGFSQSRYWVAAGAEVWSGNNWSSSSGGAPDGVGPPTGVEDARFDANGLGNCTVDVAASFTNFRMDGYTGILDINGNSFTATGQVLLLSGTINDTPGTSELTINGTDFTRFGGTTFGAIVNCSATGIDFDGSTFNQDFTGTVTAVSYYDGNGGNTFNLAFTLNLEGDGGRIRMGVNNPDVFNNGVTINSRSGGTIEFSDNSAGNAITGDLILNVTDTAGTVNIADGSSASLTVSGNVTITHNTSSNAYVYLGNNGDVTIGGNLTYNNTSSGTNNLFYLANGSTSDITISGTSTVSNNSTTTNNSRIYLGDQGNVTFGNDLTISLNSNSNANQVYLNHSATSANTYSGNITFSTANANTDGIFFGNNGGSGSLAVGQNIQVGGAGFNEGTLQLRNFTQLGATAQSITLTDNAVFEVYDASFGGNVIFTSPRFNTRGTTYSGTATITKNGSGDDYHFGANSFAGNVILNHSGSNNWRWANSSADIFGGDVTLNHSGLGNFDFAYGTGNTTVSGDLNISIINNGSNMIISGNTDAQLSVTGSTTINNTSLSNSNIYLGNNGDVNISGNLLINNNSIAATAEFFTANTLNSDVIISGKVNIINSSTGTNSRIFLPNDGNLTLTDSLIIQNSSSATNSMVYVGSGPVSAVSLNGHVLISNSNPASDGIYFGNASSTITLAATRTINIGPAGFAEGYLYLNNFTQVGATAQSLVLTGNAFLDVDNASFGGNISFEAPRLIFETTSVSGTSSITKTGSGDDQSNGGNTFTGDVTLTNSGSNDLRWGNNLPDVFNGNLTINNPGSDLIQLARSSKNNLVAGNLTINISGSSGAPDVQLNGDTSSSIEVTGTVTVNNTASGTSNNDIYLANSGDVVFSNNVVINNSATGNSGQVWISNSQYSDVSIANNLTITNDGSANTLEVYAAYSGSLTIGGNLTITNSNSANTGQVYVADISTSSATIIGNIDITNNGSGSSKMVYLGDDGDVTLTGTLDVLNSSDATTSQIRVGYQSNSSVLLNNNVTLQATNAGNDEISFGDNGGTVTLAAPRTVSIGAGGFIEGNLTFRNFTQIGATAQSLTITGTGVLENYDANWGGNVTFVAPRVYTRGTTYAGTSSFTKNGSGDDRSAGGNNFVGNAIFSVLGDNRLALGEGSPDIFGGNLTYNNTSDGGDFELAYNSAGNTIAGNLVLNHTPTNGSATIVISRNSASTLSISGTTTLNNGGTPSDSPIYFGYDGNITFGDDLTINNTITSGTSNVYLAQRSSSTLVINGNLSCTNSGSGTTERVYIGDDGDLTLNGTLTLTNNSTSNTAEFYAADGSTSDVTIANNVTAVNNGSGTTSRYYLGNSGNITFNGNISLSNTSGATNSEMRLNYTATSTNAYNGNIVVENTNANGDGITFGENGGTGILAATQTLTIGAGGFNSGDLEFRNFTRTGATTTTLTCTGTARIYSYDSFWNGDVNFTAPRILTRGTTYSGVTTLEKTGASDDASAGGNTFADDLTATNSGSNYFMFGNGTSDTFNGNVTLNNTGSDEIYFAYDGAGHSVAGDLTINNLGSSGNTIINVCDRVGSSLSVTGNIIITNNGTSSSNITRIPTNGTLTLGGDLTLNNSGNATTNEIYISNGGNSDATINGNVSIVNQGGGTNCRVYFGSNGDITLNGNITLSNTSSATTSDFRLADGSNSIVTISGTSSFTNSGSGTSSYCYLGNSGNVTFNDDLLITNSTGITNSELRLNYSGTSTNTYNGNIVVENTNANGDGIRFGENGGTGVLAASKTITIGAGGFNGGDLQFRNFTRTGATATNLTCTGNARIYSYDATWQGDVSFTAPQILIRGSSFAANTTIEKTGSGSDASAGGNTFTGNLDATNSGSGYLMFGNGTQDTFNGNVTLNNTGSSDIYFAYNGLGHSVAGDFTLNNSGTSGNTNIIICDGGTSSLTVGGETIITNNGSGTNCGVRFGDDGALTLQNNLTITNNGTAATSEVIVSSGSGASTIINGNVSITNSGSGTTKRIYFGSNGDITLNGNLSITNDASAPNSDPRIANGGNSAVSITGTCELINSATGTNSYIYAGTSGDITFGSDVTATNNSGETNSEIRFNYSGSCENTFNGSITIENTNDASDGISFGRNGGIATLAAGQTLTIGAGGFNGGDLHLRNFTQTGATSQSLTLTGTARFYPYSSTFNGDLTVSTPSIYNRQTTFNGITSFTKTGTNNEITYGGCIFNNNVTFTVSGTGYLGLANNEANDYNGDVTLVQTNTGYLRPDYNRDCSISGNLNLNLTTQTRFGDAGGSIIFDGSGNQSINDLGPGVEHIFEEMTINKSGGELTINTPIIVESSLTFTNGIINTTETNIITITDNGNVSGASNAAYVDGPIIKLGNDAFTFPVGDGGNYQPIGIGAPNSGSASFRAQYFMANPSNSFDINFNDANLDHVSSREFWILDRLATTATADVILTFDANSGDVDNLADLRIARWDGAEWVSEGNGGTTGTTAAGTLQSTTRVSNFSPFTFGSSTTNNPLPVDLADFNGRCESENVEFSWTTLSELNNDFFEILASENGTDFYSLSSINGKGTSNETNHYHQKLKIDFLENDFLLFKLKQVDFDGKESFSDIKKIENCETQNFDFDIYPNPVTEGFAYLPKSINQNTYYKVISITGAILQEGWIPENNKLIFEKIAAGVYFLQLETNNTVYKKRFVIQ